MVSASDLKDFFNTTADVTKSIAGDVTSIRNTFDMANYKVPRKDAVAIATVAPGGEFEKNRAANAATSATNLALKSGSMNFGALFGGGSSSFITIAALAIGALVIWKMVK
jgi:hypothetical protein